MNSLQRALSTLFFAGAFLVLGQGFATRSYAGEDCHRVHGHIHSTFTTTNCTSPIGLCTEGMITGAGFLDSATTFLALDAAPSAGMPAVEPSANLSYSGVLTINARKGTLVTHDLGVLDAATASFTEASPLRPSRCSEVLQQEPLERQCRRHSRPARSEPR